GGRGGAVGRALRQGRHADPGHDAGAPAPAARHGGGRDVRSPAASSRGPRCWVIGCWVIGCWVIGCRAAGIAVAVRGRGGGGGAAEGVRWAGVAGGVHGPDWAAVAPGLAVRGLARVVERLGVRLYEHTPVLAIEPGLARTAHGRVRAEVVVRATEAYTPGLPGLLHAVAPAYPLTLATEPL